MTSTSTNETTETSISNLKKRRVVTSTEILQPDDDIVEVDSTGGAMTLTIPTAMWDRANARQNVELTIIKVTGAGIVTIDMQEGTGTQTIYGGASFVIPSSSTDTYILTNPTETSGSGIGFIKSRYSD